MIFNSKISKTYNGKNRFETEEESAKEVEEEVVNASSDN